MRKKRRKRGRKKFYQYVQIEMEKWHRFEFLRCAAQCCKCPRSSKSCNPCDGSEKYTPCYQIHVTGEETEAQQIKNCGSRIVTSKMPVFPRCLGTSQRVAEGPLQMRLAKELEAERWLCIAKYIVGLQSPHAMKDRAKSDHKERGGCFTADCGGGHETSEPTSASVCQAGGSAWPQLSNVVHCYYYYPKSLSPQHLLKQSCCASVTRDQHSSCD